MQNESDTVKKTVIGIKLTSAMKMASAMVLVAAVAALMGSAACGDEAGTEAEGVLQGNASHDWGEAQVDFTTGPAYEGAQETFDPTLLDGANYSADYPDIPYDGAEDAQPTELDGPGPFDSSVEREPAEVDATGSAYVESGAFPRSAAGQGCGGVSDPFYNRYPCCSGAGNGGGNCTWYSAFRRQDLKKAPNSLGDARQWASNAASYGWPVSSSPFVGAIVAFPWNHVAYVTGYDSTRIWVSEQQCGYFWGTRSGVPYTRNQGEKYIGFKQGTSRAPWHIGSRDCGNGYEIWKYGPSGWQFGNGCGVAIAVDSDGTAYHVNRQGTVYKQNGDGWINMGAVARDIGAGGGQVWHIGINPSYGGYQLWKWDSGRWVNVPGGGVRVAVDCDGTAYHVNQWGTIYKQNGSGWTSMGAIAQDIGVGG